MDTSIAPPSCPPTSNTEWNKTIFARINKIISSTISEKVEINTTNLDLWNHLFAVEKELEKSNRSQIPVRYR